jgi:hypothetical protein
MLVERTYISQFDVQANKSIGIRKTIEILRRETVGEEEIDTLVSSTFWRTVLKPHDPKTLEVLGDEEFYLNLALVAWADVPEESIEESVTPSPGGG